MDSGRDADRDHEEFFKKYTNYFNYPPSDKAIAEYHKCRHNDIEVKREKDAIKYWKNYQRIQDAVISGDLKTLKTYDPYTLRITVDPSSRKSLLSIAAIYNQVDIINYLIDVAKIPVNQRNSQNDTALHYAAYFGANESIQALIRKGADIRLQNNYLLTAEQMSLEIFDKNTLPERRVLSKESEYLLHVRTLESIYKFFGMKKKTELPKIKSNANRLQIFFS